MNRPVNNIDGSSYPLARGMLLLTIVLALTVHAAAPAPAPPTAPATDAAKAQAAKEAELLKLFQSESDLTNSLGMTLVWLPESYRVAQLEVTQADYQAIMGENPSRFPGARRPVEQVSWTQAKAFCQKLTEQESQAGLIPKGFAYALPTEAQWEFYVDDARLEDAITSHLGDRRNTENVGGLRPNKYGLYDTRGNVWEWCSTPVARGASWRNHEDYLATNFRYVGNPDLRYDDIGFRIVLQVANPVP
jgi:formylglycine-generating enzyme required for sulfatase activity